MDICVGSHQSVPHPHASGALYWPCKAYGRCPTNYRREGNNWSHAYCRRQWSLADADHLRYRHLQAFEAALHALDDQYHFVGSPHQIAFADDADQVQHQTSIDELHRMSTHTGLCDFGSVCHSINITLDVHLLLLMLLLLQINVINTRERCVKPCHRTSKRDRLNDHRLL